MSIFFLFFIFYFFIIITTSSAPRSLWLGSKVGGGGEGVEGIFFNQSSIYFQSSF